MSTVIQAGNATNGGASISSDTAGSIQIQTGSTPTTAITVDTSQNISLTAGGQLRGNATSVPPLLADSAGNTASCRAWANFDGTASSITARASFNVSSITKNGTGDYTINFNSALPDANYAVLGSISGTSGSTENLFIANSTGAGATSAPTTTSVRVASTTRSAGAANDSPYMSIAIFR